MSFASLPLELLDIIIGFSLPEGIENLATTCKNVYVRCIPFIGEHKAWRSRYNVFRYGKLLAASDLIRLIASDRRVAKYIRTAELTADSWGMTSLSEPVLASRSLPNIEDGGSIIQLFAESRHLQRADLDWREYYTVFSEDVRMGRYSQNGSAFVLTLLVNVEHLTLPNSWNPDAATNRLLDVLVGEAKHAELPFPPLRSIKKMTGNHWEASGLQWARPFLTLPRLEDFSASFSFALGHPKSLAFGGMSHIAEKLRTIHLHKCYIHEDVIADLLKHTPYLEKLHHSHVCAWDARNQPIPWNLCAFINAIAREAGSHLFELSVTTRDWNSSIADHENCSVVLRKGSACFQKLTKFKCPLDYFLHNISSTDVAKDIKIPFLTRFSDPDDLFVRDLLPKSLTHLTLMRFDPFYDRIDYSIALDLLFCHFRALRKFHLCDLGRLRIFCTDSSGDNYNQQCSNIMAEARRVGVTVDFRWGND